MEFDRVYYSWSNDQSRSSVTDYDLNFVCNFVHIDSFLDNLE